MSLTQLSIDEFLQQLAADSPTPGGGSAAALTGAPIYGVPTRTLNQAVKRNAGRFPVDFAFQLAPEEVAVCGRKWPAQPGEPTGHSL